ncbi:MAG: type IV pilus modification PilV family protein [Chthoniobacterales bacterium]
MKEIPTRHPQGAFTLVEVLIALGIFAFATTSLLVLFPMAHRSERESDAETRATLIASSIMEALELPSSGGLVRLQIGKTNATPLWMFLDPRSKTNQSVAYNSACEPLHPLNGKEQLEPIPDHETASVATLSLAPKTSIPFLSTAEVEVAFPSSAPAANRTIHRFVRLLNVTSPATPKP